MRQAVAFLAMCLGSVASAVSQVVECATACTVTVVHELSLPPLQLTLEEGAVISLAVIGVWVVGFAFRALIRMVRTADRNDLHEGGD